MYTVVVLCLLATTVGHISAENEQETSLVADALRVWKECKGANTCLKVKLAGELGRAMAAPELSLAPGMAIVRDPLAPQIQESEAENLARSANDKDGSLDNLIADNIAGFFKTHSIQFRLNEVFGTDQEEGRRRKGRRTLTALLLMGMMMAGTLLPIKLGTLALLAGKALIISKLALALAAIIGLKKLLSSNDDHDHSYQVVSHHGHNRNFDDTASDLAYRAHAPQ